MPHNGNGHLREKVEFPINEEVWLTLDHDDGSPVTGKHGEQYMYTFDGSKRIAWLDPHVRERIFACGARRGDEICITKREVRDGNRKRIDWLVQKVEEDSGEPEQKPTPPKTTSRLEQAAAAWAAATAPTSRPRSAPAQTEPAATIAGIPLPAAAAPAAAIAQAPEPDANRLAQALKLAIDAAITATEYARSRGMQLALDSQDVRLLATTAYINGGDRR